jgi:hypothetical protein
MRIRIDGRRNLHLISREHRDDDFVKVRNFGFLFASIFGVILGMLLPGFRRHELDFKFLILGLIFLVFAVFKPAILKGPYQSWMRLAHILGALNARIVLGLVYIFLFCPVGIYFRLSGRDRLGINWKRKHVTTFKIFAAQSGHGDVSLKKVY